MGWGESLQDVGTILTYAKKWNEVQKNPSQGIVEPRFCDVKSGGELAVSFVTALSLWSAGTVLWAFGFGRAYLRRMGLTPASMAMFGLMVLVLAWWTPASGGGHLRVNMGFLLLMVSALTVGIAMGKPRWWLLWLLLGLLASFIRRLAPITLTQAQVMPILPMEALGLGLAAASGTGEPMAAAVVAAGAEALGALITTGRHGGVEIGRHDFSIVALAAVSAWILGWLWRHGRVLLRRWA